MVDDSAIVCHCAAKKHWDLLNRKKQGATSSQTSSAIIFSGKMAHFWGCSILKQTQIRQIPCFVARFARPKLPLLWRTAREIPRKKNDLHHDGLSATLCGVYICDLFAVFFWLFVATPQKQKRNLSLLNIYFNIFNRMLPFPTFFGAYFSVVLVPVDPLRIRKWLILFFSAVNIQSKGNYHVSVFCSPDFQTIISCC